ncbi:hypothetical protein P154DRAFT_532650 [Amniculicola lignicola CBS 123094]|uniref:Uncharacterized protein n=1 Tax=Amniculicola lignicola CBS 123094 TaxID=1392246 RepID=A0A6A5WQH9_9PLEO|nr:hypothetical protein P154DRAFT_532650 [Amniculicola lignicola CBS 123094]
MSSHYSDDRNQNHVPLPARPIKYSLTGKEETRKVYAIVIASTSHHGDSCPGYRIHGAFKDHFAFPSHDLAPEPMVEIFHKDGRSICLETWCGRGSTVEVYCVVDDFKTATWELKEVVKENVGKEASEPENPNWITDENGDAIMWYGIGGPGRKYRIDITETYFADDWDWRILRPESEEEEDDTRPSPCGGEDPQN